MVKEDTVPTDRRGKLTREKTAIALEVQMVLVFQAQIIFDSQVNY